MNKKITELTEATEMHDEDLLMIVQNNQNKKIKGININSISIGPTEPENNTRGIWIRNGKNLFNGKYIENYGYDQSTGNLIPTSAVYCNQDMIELPLGATKVITSKSGISLNTRYFFYDKNRDYMSSLAGMNNVSVPEGARYINFQMTMETANNDMSNIQVETEEVTEYEEYVAPGIFVKNDKGQYYNILGLMQMQNKTYLTIGVEIFTNEYINEKPIFKKRIATGNLPNVSFKNISTGLKNIDVIKIEGIVKNSGGTILPIPFCTTTTNINNIQVMLTSNGENIQITTGINRSDYSGYIDVYYTKNT